MLQEVGPYSYVESKVKFTYVNETEAQFDVQFLENATQVKYWTWVRFYHLLVFISLILAFSVLVKNTSSFSSY